MKMAKLDKDQAKKAQNKYGLFSRLNINEEIYNGLDPFLQDQYINK